MIDIPCIIKNGWCTGCGKHGDNTAICFFDDPKWFGQKVSTKRITGTRLKIFKRDGFKCLACGSNDNLTIDHIIPKSIGGKNSLNNLQTLCLECNQFKGNRIRDYRLVNKSETV